MVKIPVIIFFIGRLQAFWAKIKKFFPPFDQSLSNPIPIVKAMKVTLSGLKIKTVRLLYSCRGCQNGECVINTEKYQGRWAGCAQGIRIQAICSKENQQPTVTDLGKFRRSIYLFTKDDGKIFE
jgi:hypothetical protein